MACGLIAALSTGAAAVPVTVPIGPDLAADGWEHLTFDGIPKTRFSGDEEGVLSVQADRSSSVLYRPVGNNPIAATKFSWSWQVIEGLPATDLTKTDGDDRVMAVFVGFADDGLMSRFKSMISPMGSGRVLTYVWGGAETAAFPHPHLPERGYMFVRRSASAPTGVWLDESVDIAADYRRAFGEEPPPVAYIGISGDADDVGTTTSAKIRNIRFE